MTKNDGASGKCKNDKNTCKCFFSGKCKIVYNKNDNVSGKCKNEK